MFRLPRFGTLYILFLLVCSTNGIGSNDKQLLENATLPSLTTLPVSPTPMAGWGRSRYLYEPSFLPIPPEARIEHAHAIVVDSTDDDAIIITYKDEADSTKCLLRWRNVSEVAELIGPKNDALCKGVPHGLITAVEETPRRKFTNGSIESSIGVLYHANNEQALHKTNMNGDIIWTVNGKLGKARGRTNTNDSIGNLAGNSERDGSYMPTWFASHPESPYIYLADGYGSSKIYVLNKHYGNYTGHSFGGYGTEHGKFSTCHSIVHDWRFSDHEMVVCDRENHRLEYFRVDPLDPSLFEYSRTVSFAPLLRRPCNLRVRPGDGYAIVPFLEGSVAILDRENTLVDVINVTATLGDEGFLHPHDAHFVPGTPGDFVVVTWNPGRIGYFRRVPGEEHPNAAVSENSW